MALLDMLPGLNPVQQQELSSLGNWFKGLFDGSMPGASGPVPPMGAPAEVGSLTMGMPPPTGIGLGDIVQKLAEAGVPPPPNVQNVNVPPAATAGTPPQGTPQATGANAAALPQAKPATTQFDLMTTMSPALATPAAPAPMILPGAPGSPEAAAAEERAAKAAAEKKAPSPLSALKAPASPQGLMPSTPAAPQMKSVDLDPMTALVQQVLAQRARAQTMLPQLSAFLQRRPQS